MTARGVGDEAQLPDRVLRVFARTTGVDVRGQQHVRLFEAGLLDSLRTITLMLALADEFGIALSLGEFEPADWATPRRLIAYVRGQVRSQHRTSRRAAP